MWWPPRTCLLYTSDAADEEDSVDLGGRRFFQAEDGIRDRSPSRGLGDVYKRQPYSGPNHSPTILSWGSNPGYVVAPTNTATLSVTANDAELDPLTYRWSVTNQPAGANAVLVNSNDATTVA